MTLSDTFTSFYILPSTRTAEADPASTGKIIVSIISARLENEASYPRYFDTEVRVSISTGTTEVANCTKDTQDNAPTSEIINGISFITYPIQDAAMMQYIEGKSYRTIHNGTCFVIEQLKTGSNYKDDKSSNDIADSVLESYYNDLNAVVASFRFTK